MRRGWLLWADWCAATGRAALPVTVEALVAFEHDVPRARVADIRATVVEVGATWPGGPTAPDPWEAAEQGLAPLAASLRGCPSTGWPDGYRGRRDAWLLVLTRGLRLCRREALAVRSPAVVVEEGQVRVAGRLAERNEDPAACWACVTARWLVAVAEEWRWGRSGVREMLATATRDRGHVCDGPLPVLPGHVLLAPAIDRHGWATDWRPMTPRAVTGVLAARCVPGLPEWQPAEADDTVEVPGRAFDETTFERLDAACALADEVNGRVVALLAETDAALGRRGSVARAAP